jgi:predicted transposase/invertase (TIGR01784 family)
METLAYYLVLTLDQQGWGDGMVIRFLVVCTGCIDLHKRGLSTRPAPRHGWLAILKSSHPSSKPHPTTMSLPLKSRYIDPKTDLAFKLVFANDVELLKSFLNALLPLPGDAQIEGIEYLSAEQVPPTPGQHKRSVLDVKCQDAKGRIFIVEMQIYWSGSFEKRIVFEACQAYVIQPVDEARTYASLNPVYALALTNTVFVKDSPEYYHHYQIIHTQNPKQVLKGLEFVFIEIPKFKPQTHPEKRMAVNWLRFMSQVGKDDAMVDEELLADPVIAKALKIVEVAALSPGQLALYNQELDKIRLDGLYAFDARQEGLAEGLAKGLAEGLAEGKVEGLAEGELKGKAALIKTMHANGMDIAQISLVTGYSPEHVRACL